MAVTGALFVSCVVADVVLVFVVAVFPAFFDWLEGVDLITLPFEMDEALRAA
jgi:hypothetical protein